MIRKDFIDGGFPISRRSPVICSGLEIKPSEDTSHRQGVSMTICYNRYDLKLAIKQYMAPCICMGIWPGKKITDGFVLNPETYSKFAPPEVHKDIDSADSITVIFYTDNTFNRILYTPGAFVENQIPVMSMDRDLYEYVKNIGLNFKAVIE